MGNPTPDVPKLTPDMLGVVADALAMFSAALAPRVEVEAVDAEGFALMFSISVSKVHDLNARGLCPSPILLGDGRCNRWMKKTLLDWAAANCPSRSKWEQIQAAADRRAGRVA